MSRLFSVTLWVLTVLTLPVIFLTLAGTVFFEPLAGVLGVVFAVLYLVIVIWALSRTPLWPDFRSFRRTREGRKRRRHGSTMQWVAASLLWGAFVSTALLLVPAQAVIDLTRKWGWDFFMASFGGAYPEEIVKSLGIAIILLVFRQLNRPWHGLVTGALVGLGFEVNENFLYGVTGALIHANSDVGGVLFMWGSRTLYGPLIHTILSAFAGYGIALAFFRANKTRAWRWGVALAWIFVAFALHFAWNMLWDSNIASIINIVVISLIMYPLFIYLIWRNWRDARADGTYGYAPGVITTTRDLALIDAPTTPPSPATLPVDARGGKDETAIE